LLQKHLHFVQEVHVSIGNKPTVDLVYILQFRDTG
jgi:hypothetical protein